jgi:hypothetical protein
MHNSVVGLTRNRAIWVFMVIGVIGASALFLTGSHEGEVFAKEKQKDQPELNVFNLKGKAIGSVDAEGTVYNLVGRPIGSVDENGVVYSISKAPIGQVDPDGQVSNRLGKVIGMADPEGNVFVINGKKVGSVEPPEPGDIDLIGGAAFLLLLKTH